MCLATTEELMAETATTSIFTAIQHLTQEEIDRLRLKLWRRFEKQLYIMPDAPNPDDLLNDTIEDLLAERRRCPLAQVQLVVCLMKIVRSKVSHLYQKWKQERIIHESEEVLEREEALKRKAIQESVQEENSPLRCKILELVADEPLLTSIVSYRLEHADEEPLRARRIAEVLGIGKEIYNADRRLKDRLEKLLSYRFTQRNLRLLKLNGVPETIIENLHPLQSQEFADKHTLLDAVEAQIGKEQTAACARSILQFTWKLKQNNAILPD